VWLHGTDKTNLKGSGNREKFILKGRICTAGVVLVVQLGQYIVMLLTFLPILLEAFCYKHLLSNKFMQNFTNCVTALLEKHPFIPVHNSHFVPSIEPVQAFWYK
jgi:hypothetical protein